MAEARSALSRLTLEEKASQILMLSIPGKSTLPASSAYILASLKPGGILLFGFNIPQDPLELGNFACEMQDAGAHKGIPLVVAIDHEGGSVFRFGTSLTRIPSARELGERPPSHAYRFGAVSATELRALGIAMVLAPVVELKTADNELFLGSRSYGSDPNQVDESAGAFLDGLQSWGPNKLAVAATAKHFPGNSGEDPHRSLGVLDISREGYERLIAPRFASAARRGVAAVMLSHLRFGAVSGQEPSSLSAAVIGGLLKGSLGFHGVALTDDLYMGAIAGIMPPEESAVRAVAAGADFLMLSSAASARSVRDAVVASVRSGKVPMSRLNDAVFRILVMKFRFSMDRGLNPGIRERDRKEFPALLKKNRKNIEKMERFPR
jgi:beta-N-acetylhexosaminidase